MNLKITSCKVNKHYNTWECNIDTNVYYNIPETKIAVTDDTKFKIVDEVLQYTKDMNYNYIDVDGVRVQFDDGWALVRASNTGPNLTIRFEASTEERLNEIRNEFEKVVNEAIEKCR